MTTLPFDRRYDDERGFSMVELLVGVSLTLIIMATTLGALTDGIRAGDTDPPPVVVPVVMRELVSC